MTVVGHAAAIAAGEWITASGDWINDRTHGQQFKARFLRTSPPTSADGIQKYLSSGMIRGVGPVMSPSRGLPSFIDCDHASPHTECVEGGIGDLLAIDNPLRGNVSGELEPAINL
jgi:hypothetical protein